MALRRQRAIRARRGRVLGWVPLGGSTTCCGRRDLNFDRRRCHAACLASQIQPRRRADLCVPGAAARRGEGGGGAADAGRGGGALQPQWPPVNEGFRRLKGFPKSRLSQRLYGLSLTLKQENGRAWRLFLLHPFSSVFLPSIFKSRNPEGSVCVFVTPPIIRPITRVLSWCDVRCPARPNFTSPHCCPKLLRCTTGTVAAAVFTY